MKTRRDFFWLVIYGTVSLGIHAKAQQGPPGTVILKDVKADAQTAVSTITKLYTVNSTANVSATGQPLPMSGSWSAQMLKSEACPAAVACMRVLYRVPTAQVVCTWDLEFDQAAAAAKDPASLAEKVVDENEDARAYTIKIGWLPGETRPKVETTTDLGTNSSPQSVPSGYWVMDIVVDRNGTVKSVDRRSGPDADYVREMQASMMKWRFHPQMVGGKPIVARLLLNLQATNTGPVVDPLADHWSPGGSGNVPAQSLPH